MIVPGRFARPVCLFLLGGLLGAWPLAASAVDVQKSPAPPTGQIEIQGTQIRTIELEGKGGTTVSFDRPGQTISVPAGEYRLSHVALSSGPAWQLRRGDEEPWFHVSPDKVLTLRAGAPLRPNVEVSASGGVLTLAYSVRDFAGREFKGQRTGGRPRFTITRDGQEVGAGAFSYG